MRNGLAVTGKIRNAATCAVYVSSRSFPRLDACVCIQPTIIHNPPPVRGGYGRLEITGGVGRREGKFFEIKSKTSSFQFFKIIQREWSDYSRIIRRKVNSKVT